MTAILAFLITLSQLILLITAYVMPWKEVMTLLAVHFSPVMVFFALLQAVVEFTGEFSYWLGCGLVYCFVKYFIIGRAMVADEPSLFYYSALLMEVLYLAGSTFYIVYFSYL